jgi:rhodanese-related sulfurtransferase
MIVLSICVIVIALILYKRYVPVRGVRNNSWEDLDLKKVAVIDLRDYNESYKTPIKGAKNIPIAYLNRFYNEIPKRELYVIGSSSLEKNIGIRFLRQKGFKVIGFTIIESDHFWFNENLCI